MLGFCSPSIRTTWSSKLDLESPPEERQMGEQGGKMSFVEPHHLLVPFFLHVPRHPC